MNKFIKIFLTISLLIIFVSCSDGINSPSTSPTNNPTTDNPTTGEEQNNGEKLLKTSSTKKLKLDIMDATNLYIGKSTASTNSSRAVQGDVVNKLFKITENGYSQEITYQYDITVTNEYEITYDEPVYDENGNQTGTEQKTKTETRIETKVETATESFVPSALYGVNEDYLYVCFESDSYLVRKSDGAAFIVPSSIGLPSREGMDFMNANPIRFDDNNNMYYLYDHKIRKINLSGIESLSSSIVSASTDYVAHFEVDKNGNLVYSGSSNSSTYSPLCRVRKTNGGLANISYMGGNSCFDGWKAPDGFVYCIKYDDEANNYVINKMFVDENNNFSEVEYGHIDTEPYCVTTEYTVNLKDYGIIVDTNPCKIFEVFNKTNTPRVVNLDGISFNTISAVVSTDNYYFIAGTDSNNKTFLIRIDPTNDSYINIIPKNEYDVYAFSADEHEGIIFNALRMSDGKRVIGKVDIYSNNLNMIDEENDVEIIYLEKIN